MPRRKKTPAGGTAGAGAAWQVAANDASAPQYSTSVKSPQQGALPLALSQQIDCCLFLEETITDPLARRFAMILRRRLEENIPESRT